MKRIANIFLLILTTLLLISCGEITEQQARQALDKHLKNKYGEEFEISYLMRRRAIRDKEFYQAEIYPKKYNGIEKEYDKYYKANGTVVLKNILSIEKIGFVGDTYGIVKINEAVNEFYGKKLKELFGKNVLPVFDILFNYDMQEPTMEKIIEYSKKEGKSTTIKGGIYIFGRVENDEDREWYRKQIYEFIQFMKKTGTFEYVDLDILVIDERILLNKFQNNSIGTLTKLSEIPENVSEEEFLKKRKNIMNELNIYFEDNKEYKENLEKINKSKLREEGAAIYTIGNNLLYLKVYSPKYIKIQGYKKEINNYNTSDEIKFNWERWL